MLYKVSVVERLAFQSVMNIASCLTGKKKKKECLLVSGMQSSRLENFDH